MTDAPGNASAQAKFFEALHRDPTEPFSYSTRAVEQLRHEWIVREVAKAADGRVLDLGCSRGQLTSMIAELGVELTAIDIAPAALAATKQRVATRAVRLTAGSALALPIADRRMDFVVVADGIYSWNLETPDRDRCLREIHRVLAPSGRALFTEHTRASHFGELVQQIARNGFTIEWVEYLYDRPWYQVESWFKALQGTSWVAAARRNRSIAHLLRRIGRLFGPRASRHICVLARKTD